MNYREKLYSGYSTNFGDLKAFDQGRSMFPAFDSTYANFSKDKSAHILDAGCGKGEWLAWLSQRGYQHLYGIDGAAADLEVAHRWLPEVKFDLGQISNFLKETTLKFDVIHAKDVIEHFTKGELIEFLALAREALSDQGEIWLQTFNAQAPMASATRYGDFTHEIGLTPTSLAQCLRATGYDVRSICGVHYCSSSTSGRIRSILSAVIHRTARIVLQARHGGSKTASDSVDRLCALPDMLAIATKRSA